MAIVAYFPDKSRSLAVGFFLLFSHSLSLSLSAPLHYPQGEYEDADIVFSSHADTLQIAQCHIAGADERLFSQVCRGFPSLAAVATDAAGTPLLRAFLALTASLWRQIDRRHCDSGPSG